MDLKRSDAVRHYAQYRRRARTMPARVALPVVLASSAQILLIVAGIALGLPVLAVLGLALGLAFVSATLHRRTVGSLVAGAGIRVARPYEPGERVRMRVPSRGRVETVEVVRVGPANTTLMTDDGLVVVPNALMLRGR